MLIFVKNVTCIYHNNTSKYATIFATITSCLLCWLATILTHKTIKQKYNSSLEKKGNNKCYNN